MLRTRAFLLLCVSNTLTWGFGAGIFFNLVSITREAGLDPADLAPCVYVPWAITRALSMMISGHLTDRFEPRSLLCVGALGVGVGFLLLAPPDGVPFTPGRGAAFGVVHGVMNGLCNAVFRTAPARFFGRTHLGAIMGTCPCGTWRPPPSARWSSARPSTSSARTAAASPSSAS